MASKEIPMTPEVVADIRKNYKVAERYGRQVILLKYHGEWVEQAYFNGVICRHTVTAQYRFDNQIIADLSNRFNKSYQSIKNSDIFKQTRAALIKKLCQNTSTN